MTREEREKAIQELEDGRDGYSEYISNETFSRAIEALKRQPCEDTGEVSDGYHTFNQLYHQRAVLFATIVNEHPSISWKSFKHSDGHYCFDEDGEMFIVGIDTPEGSYTYHYHKKYWDLFKCQELECGKEWDGHTEKDVTRLLSLKQESCGDTISRQAVIDIVNNPLNIRLDEIIKKLPPVTPQPKTAYWISWYEIIEEEWGTEHNPHCKCSECNTEVDPHTSKFINCCPVCGAKMVGYKKREEA